MYVRIIRNVGVLTQLSNNTFKMYASIKQRRSLDWIVIDVAVLHAGTIRFGRRSKFRTFTEYMAQELKREPYFYVICFRLETQLCVTCFCHPQFSAQSLITTVPNATPKTLDIRYRYSLSYYFRVCIPARNCRVLYCKLPSERPKM